jgi:hypothetical protein
MTVKKCQLLADVFQLSGDFRFCTPDGNFQVVVFGAVALKIEV